MLQKVQVHAIPSEKVDRKSHTLFQTNTSQWLHTHSSSDNVIPHHLYFTTDEGIKVGDIVYRPTDNKVLTCTENMLIATNQLGLSWNAENRKVVATTNPDLWEKTFRMNAAMENYNTRTVPTGIAKIPQSFLQAFVEQQGIWGIILETEVDPTNPANWYRDVPLGKYSYDEPVPPSPDNLYTNGTRRLKLNPDGTVITHPILKNTCSKEDLIDAFEAGYQSAKMWAYKVDGTYQEDLNKFLQSKQLEG